MINRARHMPPLRSVVAETEVGRKRKSSLVFSQENGEEWSMGQQVAFIVSVLVILGMVSNRVDFKLSTFSLI